MTSVMHKRFLPLLLLCAALASAAVRSDMLVDTAWLAQHLNDAKVVVLHVSTNRTAYDAGHIPGARFIGLSEIAILRDGVPNELPPAAELKKILEQAGVSDDTRVIIYTDASILPAARAYFTMDYLGHGDHAAVMDGGLAKWRAENRAVTQAAPTVTAGHFTPHVRPEAVADMSAVKEMLLAAKTKPASAPVLLDVRSEEEFKTAGHIPGAQNLYWVQGQASGPNSEMKSETDLRKLYETIGNKQVVTYCNSGMQASQSYFTLKYLGYDVRMYDGSFSEWSKAKDAPIEK